LSRRCLDIDGQIYRIGEHRIYAGRHTLSFGQVRRFCGSFRMAKARAIQQHLFLLPPGQVRESLGCSRTLEGKKTVAIHT
jgi:hypothetical protein